MSDIIQSTTQQFLDIYDITNNYVIMKDGTVSTILTVDAMNFGLLAEEEQDAIMYAYAGLLNSLNYTVQIIINSRTKDVTSYLKVLQEQEGLAENETLRRRIRMYREFVGNLIHERNVLDKKFYVVIPAAAVEMGFLAPSSVLPGKKSAFDISSIERSVIIEKAQNLLDPKRDHLIAQFARIGLYSRQLTTQEIIQLFYVQYNPEAAEGQQIGESITYTTPLVKASIQGNFMNITQPPVQQSASPVEPALAPEAVLDFSATQTTTPADPQHVQPLPEIHVAQSDPSTQASGALSPTPAGFSPEPQNLDIHNAPGLSTAPFPLIPNAPAPLPFEPAPTQSSTPLGTPSAPPLPPTPTAEITAPPWSMTPPSSGSTPDTTNAALPATPPAVSDSVPTSDAPPIAALEKDLQADLNATVQALGTTPGGSSSETADSAPSSDQPQADLPPLPEI